MSEKIARNARIIAEYEAGSSISDIAGRVGLSKQRVDQIIRQAGARRTCDCGATAHVGADGVCRRCRRCSSCDRPGAAESPGGGGTCPPCRRRAALSGDPRVGPCSRCGVGYDVVEAGHDRDAGPRTCPSCATRLLGPCEVCGRDPDGKRRFVDGVVACQACYIRGRSHGDPSLATCHACGAVRPVAELGGPRESRDAPAYACDGGCS